MVFASDFKTIILKKIEVDFFYLMVFKKINLRRIIF